MKHHKSSCFLSNYRLTGIGLIPWLVLFNNLKINNIEFNGLKSKEREREALMQNLKCDIIIIEVPYIYSVEENLMGGKVWAVKWEKVQKNFNPKCPLLFFI